MDPPPVPRLQVWVKTPQMLMRDRLQQMYTVKPAIQKLKQTLLGLGGAQQLPSASRAWPPVPALRGWRAAGSCRLGPKPARRPRVPRAARVRHVRAAAAARRA